MEKSNLVKFSSEVFNEIVNVSWGSSVLVLDETFFEAVPFVTGLLSNAIPPDKVYYVSFQSVDLPFKTLKLDPDLTLSELNKTIENTRQKIAPYGVLIHHYLPRLMIKEDDASILNILNLWSTKTSSYNLLEFYILPLGAFTQLERKIHPIMNGTITIGQSKTEPPQLAFTAEDICRFQYQFREFPYALKEGRLLVKWLEEYTDYLKLEKLEQIQQKIDFLKNNLGGIRIIPTDLPLMGLTLQERWLFSQIINKPLWEIASLFPDRLNETLALIARWNVVGLLTLEKTRTSVKTSIIIKKKLKLINRLALKLPVKFSVRLLTKSPRVVPVDTYRALRSSVEIFLQSTNLTQQSSKLLTSVEKLFQETTARKVVLEKLTQNKEPLNIKFEIKYLPKIVAITFHTMTGNSNIPNIRQKSDSLWEITLDDCPYCEGAKSETPLCHMVEATLVGTCAVLFKEGFSCEEVRCRAVGEEACIFHLKRNSTTTTNPLKVDYESP